MKRLQQLLSVLLCCLLLSVVFSTNVSAEEVKTTNTKVNMYAYYTDQSNGYPISQIDMLNGDSLVKAPVYYSYPTSATQINIVNRMTFVNTDKTPLVEKADTFKFTVSNLMFSPDVSGLILRKDVHIMQGQIIYTDGTSVSLSSNHYSLIKNTESVRYDVVVNFTASKDIARIIIWLASYYGPTTNSGDRLYMLQYGADPLTIKIDKESKETGLLRTVVSWLSNIKTGITDLFNSIAELPSKLWELISNGLKSLFVPDSDTLIEFREDIEELLSIKFGAVYQVLSLLGDSWDNISANDKQNIINMPVASLRSVGIPFDFGGYDVKIVPDGFEWLVDIIKTLVGIVCTVLFINGLRKKYDELVGG